MRISGLVLIACLFVPSTVAAATKPVDFYAPLSRAVEDPQSSPGGRGLAVIKINPDRTVLTYRVTFAGVTSPITRVAFCVGQVAPPTIGPTPGPCAFSIIPAPPGGPSPIVGSVSILPSRFDVITGYGTFVELDSAKGREIRGYLLAGAPPDTATAEAIGAGPNASNGPNAPFIVGLAGVVALVACLAARPRARRRGARPERDIPPNG